MKLAIMTSAAALMLTLGMAAPASAQTAAAAMTIDGNAVSETDAPFVQTRCDTLKTEHDAATSQNSEANSDMSEGDDKDAHEGDNALSTIDLDTLTYEQCDEGGFYAKAM